MEQQEIASNMFSNVVTPNESVAIFSDTTVCRSHQCCETVSFDYINENVQSGVKIDSEINILSLHVLMTCTSIPNPNIMEMQSNSSITTTSMAFVIK